MWEDGRRALGTRAGDGDGRRPYDDFDAALAASDSYSHADIVDLVARRTEAYRNALAEGSERFVATRQTTQNLFVLSHLPSERPLDVLELGGACGGTFFELDHLLPGRIRSWDVVEVAETAEAGRRRFQNDRLKFFDDLDSAVRGRGSRDLVMTQGGLQCMPDPMATLDRLIELGCPWVYISRFEVSDDLERPIAVRLLDRLSSNGPGPIPRGLADRKTSYPVTFFPGETIRSRTSGSYRIEFSFSETEGRTKRIGSRTVTTNKAGFLLGRTV